MMFRASLSLMAALIVGCTKPAPAGPPEIAGTVTMPGGKVPPRTIIRFHRSAGGEMKTASTTVRENGSFALRGEAGTYAVTLLGPPGQADKDKVPPPGPPEGVAAKYGKASETPWRVEVPAGGKKDIALEVD